jgi:hypothetical protein
MVKRKRIYNDLQNITQKLKNEQHESHKKPRVTSGVLGEGVVHIMGCSGDRMKRVFS